MSLLFLLHLNQVAEIQKGRISYLSVTVINTITKQLKEELTLVYAYWELCLTEQEAYLLKLQHGSHRAEL